MEIVLVAVALLAGVYLGRYLGPAHVKVERSSPTTEYRLTVTANRTDLTEAELERIAEKFDASAGTY